MDKITLQLTPVKKLGLISKSIDLPQSKITLHYVETEHRENIVETVLLVHGWPDSWRSFETMIPHLRQNYRIIAVDLRGFGDSICDPIKDLKEKKKDINFFSSDLLELLETLAIEKCYVVGHSMGSIIVRNMAIINPSRIKGLVLLGSTNTARPLIISAKLDQDILNDQFFVSWIFALQFQSSTFFDVNNVDPHFFNTTIYNSYRAPIEAWKAGIEFLLNDDLTQERFLDIPISVRCRTLILSGSRETLFGDDDQKNLKKWIPGSVWKQLDKAGHSLQWDKPMETAKIINDFIDWTTDLKFE